MKKHNSFTNIGNYVGFISNLTQIATYLGIPASVCLLLLKQYLFALIVFVVVVTFFLIVRFIVANGDNMVKFVFRLFAPKNNYYYEKWEATYEYNSKTSMSFRTRYSVKALKDGVNSIRVRFNWSGATDKNPIQPKPCKVLDYQTLRIEPDGNEFGYQYYKVISSSNFNKNDNSVKLGVDIEDMNVDPKRKPSDHLLTSVNAVTDLLIMKVLLPFSIQPKNIKALEYLHATDDHHWRDRSTQIEEVESNGKYAIIWRIEKPVYGGKYIISWRSQHVDIKES